MPPFRNAATSSSERILNGKTRQKNGPGLPLLRPGFGIAAAHESHELLRCGMVVAAHVGALLRHGPGNSRTFGFRKTLAVEKTLPIDRWPGRAVSRDFNRWLAGFAGQPFIANIDVVIAHDCHPSLEYVTTHECMERLQAVDVS
jgi:hypothetical protein